MFSLLGHPQENWVRIHGYNSMSWDDLVSLWYRMNTLPLHVIEGIPGDWPGNIYHSPNGPITLDGLVNDYFRHLQVHIQQFEEGYAQV